MAVDQIPAYRRVTFVKDSSGAYFAQYNWQRFRFMFSDGETLDVVAIRDDSDLRGALLELHFGKRDKDGSIVGMATIKEPEPEPEPEPAQKTVRRTRTRKS